MDTSFSGCFPGDFLCKCGVLQVLAGSSPFGRRVAFSLATVVALRSATAIMIASNDAAALAADAGVEEGGASLDDVARRGAVAT
jgi:hypothetical protein